MARSSGKDTSRARGGRKPKEAPARQKGSVFPRYNKAGEYLGHGYKREVKGERFQGTVSGGTFEQNELAAQERLDKLNDAFGRLKSTKTASMTVAEFLDYWIERCEDRVETGDLSAHTLASYRNWAEVFKEEWPKVLLVDLTGNQIQSFFQRTMRKPPAGKGYSAASVIVGRQILRTALYVACREKRLTENPVNDTTPPKRKKKDYLFFWPQESLVFLQHLRNYPKEEGFFATSLLLALRKSEALAARREDLTRDHRGNLLLRIRGTKNETSDAHLPVPRVLQPYLARHLHYVREMKARAGDAWEENGLLFPNTHGRQWSDRRVNYALEAILRDMPLEGDREKLRGMTPHDLRRSCASVLLALGEPIQTIMAILRHSTIRTTMEFYAQISPQISEGAFGKMDDYYRELMGEEELEIISEIVSGNGSG